jgi:Fe2+ or Zn2+ uptake regulation protein
LLDFLEELGLMVVLNLKDGSSRYIQPKDPFFTGFENMHYVSHNIVKGLSDHLFSRFVRGPSDIC